MNSQINSSRHRHHQKNQRRKRRAPQVLLTTAILKSQKDKVINSNNSDDLPGQSPSPSISTSPSPPPLVSFISDDNLNAQKQPGQLKKDALKPTLKTLPKQPVTSPVAMIDTQNGHKVRQHKNQQSPKSAAIQKKKEAKARFEHRARINPMVDEPVYDFGKSFKWIVGRRIIR